MKVPVKLSEAFGAEFQKLISDFAAEEKLIPEAAAIASPRFLARSVVPHIQKLSDLFNRIESEQDRGLAPYWKESSNPAHLRLAYFLYFMPANVFRIASIWSELSRLGFRWSAGETLRGIEFGAGPATGACGIAAGEHHAPAGLPATGNWALLEQDKAMLELGSKWATRYFSDQGFSEWGTKNFHRRLDISEGLLPRSAPRFNLWLMSFFLNESILPPKQIAEALLSSWERHLDENGIAILAEPALKLQSRRLLEIRRELVSMLGKKKTGIQLLLPCLGHQACGALASEEDWCHEEVSWWRPPYVREIDKMASLDRKSLPFSYLVFVRSDKPLEELLPQLGKGGKHRLVSPAHSEGRDLEFFLCGQDGKRRARYRPQNPEEENLERGGILIDAEIKGDRQATRIQKIDKIC